MIERPERTRIGYWRVLGLAQLTSGKSRRAVERKKFEKYTIGELKEIVDGEQLESSGLPLATLDANSWMDQDLALWDDEGETPANQ